MSRYLLKTRLNLTPKVYQANGVSAVTITEDLRSEREEPKGSPIVKTFVGNMMVWFLMRHLAHNHHLPKSCISVQIPFPPS